MSCSGQLALTLRHFDPDRYERPVVALRLDVEKNDVEQPVHWHRKGQLIMALRGGVTCEVPRAMWMVPPQHAIWIPSGIRHCSQATDNACLHFVFIEPDAVSMPTECCTLAISPLIRELAQYLVHQDPEYPEAGSTARIVDVLLDQLVLAPVEQLHLPMSAHPKIRRILDVLTRHPGDRTTLVQWATQLAMSERSLSRLVMRETGLPFGRWRQQLHLIIALRQLAAGAAVRQVAGNLGYDSVTAFITMFKKALGMTPTQYFAASR